MINWKTVRQTLLGDRVDSVLPPDIKIPVLPKVLTEFLTRSKNENCTFQQLGSIIQTDAGLTCELLRSLNSSRYGLKAKVTTVSQALSLLGLRNAKLLLLSEAIKHTMTQRESRLINLQTFWNTNLERAFLARRIAQRLNVDSELAFSAAMIQDFILPALTNEHTDFYSEFMSRSKTDTAELVAAEHQHFGWDHTYVGARLLFDWEFPDEMVVCVLMHHAGFALFKHPLLSQTAATAVAVAGQLPDVLRQVPDGLDKLRHLEVIWPEFDLLMTARDVEADLENVSVNKPRHHFSLYQRITKTDDLRPAAEAECTRG